MKEVYIEEKSFEKINFHEYPLTKGAYVNCIFKHCDFSNTDLSEFSFTECAFISCNLSLANLTKTAFRDIKFIACKMLGLRFENCNDFGLSFSFEDCQLNYASFYQLKIKKTIFKNSQLHEIDFSACDLYPAESGLRKVSIV